MSLSIYNWSDLESKQKTQVLQRPDKQKENLNKQVAAIINEVRNIGEPALIEFARVYDDLQEDSLNLPSELIEKSEQQIEPELKRAIDEAYARIHMFHVSAKPEDSKVETAAGVTCEYRYRGYKNVGIYVPGGTAPLISTVLMTAIPAQIAAVDEIVLCTPAKRFADVNVGILYAAKICGIKTIYCIGGAQAIAAMAYGTESVAQVQKIFGPGNAWVTEAKQQVAFDPDGAAIDMPAGPSEVLIIADANADPDYVAMDLLSQLEHGTDSQAVLLSAAQNLLDEVSLSLEKFTRELSRKEILERSLNNVRLIKTSSIDQAIKLSNQYAPEHLLLQLESPRAYLEKIRNAGSIFLGYWTPESLGDYCSGTNHVLPTYGFARSYNGLSVMDYMQRVTIQEATKTGIKNIGECAMVLAGAEGLDAHKRAVELRLQDLDS